MLFYCFQQRKMRPFHCQRKLTHTDDAGGSDPHRDPHVEMLGKVERGAERKSVSSSGLYLSHRVLAFSERVCYCNCR